MSNGLKYVKLTRPTPYAFTNVQPVNAKLRENRSFYSMQQEFFNGFSKAVVIVNREGLKVTIPPTLNPLNSEFIVRYTLTLGADVIFNVDSLLNSTSHSSRILAKVFQEGGMSLNRNQRIFALDYHLNIEEIETRGGSLYLSNLDLLVTVHSGVLVPLHPFSEIYNRNQAVEQFDHVNNVNTFGYGLKIIDSLNQFGVRYVNINNQIYRIPIMESSALPDGVYLTSSGPVEGDLSLVKPVSKLYPFEEADTALRLYKSVESAKTMGDEFGEKEKELKRLTLHVKEREQELKAEKLAKEAEFELFKQRIERERIEEDSLRKQEENRIAQRVASLKEEIAQLEYQRTLETLKQKEYYETRSLDRKDSSETIKFLPTLITGALALFLAFIR